MYHKATLNKVEFEIEQVDKLLNKYEDLIKRCKEKEPELVELTALASVLHSFYNGVNLSTQINRFGWSFFPNRLKSVMKASCFTQAKFLAQGTREVCDEGLFKLMQMSITYKS